MITIKQWTLVPIAGGGISTQECQWRRSNINVKDWDHNFDGFLFRHERDSMLFLLRWGC